MCMARQSAAAKKKARASARARKQARKFSIMNTLEAIVIGNALTQGAFKMSLVPWAFEGWLTPQTSSSDGAEELSAAEIVKGLVPGGEGPGLTGRHRTMGMAGTIMENLRGGAAPMIVALVVTPIAFRMVRKVAGRPINMFNRMLSQTGVPVKV